MLLGYAKVVRYERRMQAWSVSRLMIAAGCDADAVSEYKLLGLKEPRQRTEEEKAERAKAKAMRVWAKLQESRRNVIE